MLQNIENILQRAGGLGEVPPLSTFSRAAKWFREQGFLVFHAQLLKDLEVRYPQNHADRQHGPAKQSLRFTGKVGSVHPIPRWFKGYKLHLCTTADGIILSHVLTTANLKDAAVAPELLVSLQQWDIDLYWAIQRMTAKRFGNSRTVRSHIDFPPSTTVIARNGKMPMVGFFLSF